MTIETISHLEFLAAQIVVIEEPIEHITCTDYLIAELEASTTELEAA